MLTFLKYFCIVFSLFCIPLQTHAAELLTDVQTFEKAQVVDIKSTSSTTIAGTETKSPVQTITVKLLEGNDYGKMATFDNDYIQLKKGEIFYLNKTVHAGDGNITYVVSDPYRLPVIYFLVGLFVFLAVVFGGKQGLRGVLSLTGSFILILYVLLPGILHGYSPILISMGVSALIIILGSYITHGFNKTTTSAVIGMIATVILTGVVAHIFVQYAHLSGMDTEESVYLNLNTRGTIDFVGLLLGGILIGLLGVLYDAAIGQAVSVEELHHIAPHVSRGIIFKRALRIGREHIGALVNTLAIAYVGVSLPLLLLFSTSKNSFSFLVNKELFATEIVRTMIGSIGLILAVPITTLLAVLILVPSQRLQVPLDLLQKEKDEVEHFEHHH